MEKTVTFENPGVDHSGGLKWTAMDLSRELVTGIILSAGESRRMGTLKQLLPWGKTIILQQVIDNALASRLGAVSLVLGYRADEVASKIRISPRISVSINQDFKAGMGSSIVCGIKAAPANAEAFMVLLGDQPHIGTAVIDKLIDSYQGGGHGIVIPVYDGRRGHPVIFGSRYREELLSIGDQGAREVVRRHSDDILEVPTDTPGVLTDIDTPQEYQEAKKRAEE
jgi:molybdenum cofactor cytidylyltransferase